jgi:DnaD/phage-associated family protein
VVPVALPQQDIFTLYEETIGLLTPHIAEQLQEAEKEYPSPWIREAFQRASEQNVRKWRYVEAILQRWKTEGKDDGTPGRRAKAAHRVADYSTWLPAKRTKG